MEKANVVLNGEGAIDWDWVRNSVSLVESGVKDVVINTNNTIKVSKKDNEIVVDIKEGK